MGGGIYTLGNLDLINVEVSDNTAELDGGGIYVGSLNMVSSAIVNNTGKRGGGIYSRFSSKLHNSTIAQNSAEQGGGIYTSNQSSMSLSHITLVANQASDNAAGISVNKEFSSAIARNSLLLGNYLTSGTEANVGGADKFSSFDSQYNLLGSGPSGGIPTGTIITS